MKETLTYLLLFILVLATTSNRLNDRKRAEQMNTIIKYQRWVIESELNRSQDILCLEEKLDSVSGHCWKHEKQLKYICR